MIEQYSITASSEKVKERFGVDVPGPLSPFYNASHTQLLPVVTHAAPKGISIFYWGTSAEWAKDKPLSEKIVNTHAELIPEKSSLRKALMKTRCIVLADSFYAWKKTGKKTFIPYRFVCTDQALFSFAGLWDEYEDTDGNQFHTFSIITVPSNSLVETVHERMPVILNKKTESEWLSKENNENGLLSVLTAYPAEKMTHYTVTPSIANKNLNVPSMIRPTAPADQHGNLTLFD
jgi:putative SOS response-associated peptidase YedK